MEVYILRKISKDGTTEIYLKNIEQLIAYKIDDHIALDIFDYADECNYIYDVIKFEVY